MKIKINKNIKSFFFGVFVLIFLFFGVLGFVEANQEVKAYLFYGEGCPHCAAESVFLESLTQKYANFSVQKYEVYFNRENAVLLNKVSELIGEPINGVPFLIIGDKYFVGYSETVSNEAIEKELQNCFSNYCSDLLDVLNQNEKKIENTKEDFPLQKEIENTLDKPEESTEKISTEENKISENELKNLNGEDNTLHSGKKSINVPILGEMDVLSFSLPLLTIVMGALDGFNPCAMWTLLFLISLLLGMENRKRMWILGIAFIVASASVYFIFMSAWLNLILFLGFVFWIRLLIGLFSVLGGGFNIRKFFKEKDGGCEITGEEKRKNVFENLKKIVRKKNFWLALLGIILLAFLVNLVELVCSAGLPAIYTQVLAMNNLPLWQYYAYISLYIFFFMLDDLFVFVIAMWTLKMTGISTRYARYSHLIGGIFMILIGFLLIFFPKVLMFG